MRRLAVPLVVLCVLTACGRERPLSIVGSSCMGEALRALARSSPQEAEVQLGGTQLGLAALKEGRADLAACSRALTPADGDLEAAVLALDAIAVVVHPDNPLKSIEPEVLRAVYEGEITDWSTLGSAAGAIVVVGRESASGTRMAFEAALGIVSPHHGQELGEDGIVRTAVAACPRAIGYLSAAKADASVRMLSIGGVSVTAESVKSGAYPLVRPFLLVSRPGAVSPAARRFLAYAAGAQGREILSDCGLFLPEAAA